MPDHVHFLLHYTNTKQSLNTIIGNGKRFIGYIHNNPCTERWKLCEKQYQYLHSSAQFYDGNRNGYKVKDYLDVLAELKYGSEWL